MLPPGCVGGSRGRKPPKFFLAHLGSRWVKFWARVGQNTERERGGIMFGWVGTQARTQMCLSGTRWVSKNGLILRHDDDSCVLTQTHSLITPIQNNFLLLCASFLKEDNTDNLIG